MNEGEGKKTAAANGDIVDVADVTRSRFRLAARLPGDP